MFLKGKNMLEKASEVGLLLTHKKTQPKKTMHGIVLYSNKVYLYCQLSTRTASRILIMQT